MSTTTQKKTSFSELSSLLQGGNHTHLKHSRQSSLKTTKSLYTVPEVKTESTSPADSEHKQKGSRFPLTSSSHQLLNTIRSKKNSQSQCLILGDQKDRRVSALSRAHSGEPLTKTFSNPINRYEYQKTFTVRPKSTSSRCTSTVTPSESPPDNSLVEPVLVAMDELTVDEHFTRPINENYTLKSKFENFDGKSLESAVVASPSSSNQSPFTKGSIVEPVPPISRRDSLTLKQFNSDLSNHVSRTQLKLDQLRGKFNEARNSMHTSDDTIYLLNPSADSRFSNNSLSPQKDVWKPTAHAKFWLNSELSTNLVCQQLNLECKMVERFNYNGKSILITRMRRIILKKRGKQTERIKSNGKNPSLQRRELSPVSTSSLTLEKFVSLNALTHFDDFPEINDSRLKSILVEGKKSCEEIWHQTEITEFISLDTPASNPTDPAILSASTVSEIFYNR
ncbi:unnamed protein product [Kluyveromyces dobzhanskii CBS 2104]|uniref:WGS project CCBQ000000000 data, contig 00058 n=1 Tax=Kluyveromyces dobzhanskii CBS 2104 TaxID=1427455 RepID=A0A0A8LDF8_9SACH|nr:unnamed protein product [Kluyveromyces dobzhanskii CBS 2104]